MGEIEDGKILIRARVQPNFDHYNAWSITSSLRILEDTIVLDFNSRMTKNCMSV